MTISEVLQSIYTRFEKSPDVPDNTSEDFAVRLEYVNSSIDKWENEQGIEWKELFGTITGTLVSGVCSDNAVALLNFKRPAGFLKIGEDKYTYVRPEKMERIKQDEPSEKVYTVTGSKGAYSIVVNPVVDGAFTLNYRKTATKFVTGSETTPIEMSDPSFCIHDVLSQLYLDDDNTTQATIEIQVASAKMDSMKQNNETDPFYNGNEIPSDSIAFGM